MRVFTIAASVLIANGLAIAQATDRPTTASAPAAASQPVSVSDTYPGLASDGLTYARLAELPKGTVLKAGDLTVTEKEIADEIAKAPKDIQDQLKKNAFYLLEQITSKQLILTEAKIHAAKTTSAPANADERILIQGYLGELANKVKISDEQVAEFYKNNKDAVGGTEFDKVKADIAAFLLRQKQQELIALYVKTLGKRTNIDVSASWVKEQAAMARDNPVDKARASGKPSLVDFGSKGCRPCDMLAPILENLKKKYDGQANVLFVSVQKEQILAARYGVDGIPAQIFFDKDGKEVFRHVGFWPQDEIEKQMAKIGVK